MVDRCATLGATREGWVYGLIAEPAHPAIPLEHLAVDVWGCGAGTSAVHPRAPVERLGTLHGTEPLVVPPSFVGVATLQACAMLSDKLWALPIAGQVARSRAIHLVRLSLHERKSAHGARALVQGSPDYAPPRPPIVRTRLARFGAVDLRGAISGIDDVFAALRAGTNDAWRPVADLAVGPLGLRGTRTAERRARVALHPASRTLRHIASAHIGGGHAPGLCQQVREHFHSCMGV